MCLRSDHLWQQAAPAGGFDVVMGAALMFEGWQDQLWPLLKVRPTCLTDGALGWWWNCGTACTFGSVMLTLDSAPPAPPAPPAPAASPALLRRVGCVARDIVRMLPLHRTELDAQRVKNHPLPHPRGAVAADAFGSPAGHAAPGGVGARVGTVVRLRDCCGRAFEPN